MSDFREELNSLINKHSLENESNTPDYVLTDYLLGCLEAFDTGVKMREGFYGRASQFDQVQGQLEERK